MASPPALKRGIRFCDLALFYVVVSFSIRWIATAAAAGPSILVVWVAALLCFFVPLAACVMELSSRYPQEGGLYIWTREAFGDFAGFLTAWTYWMSNLPLFPSLLYFGAASALGAFGPRAQWLSANPAYFIAFSLFWLAAITLLNIRGVNAGKWLNNVCSLGAFIPLTILLVLGVVSFFRFGAATHFTTASLQPHWSLGNAVFWSGVFFAFSGVEAGSAMGDEIQNPRRTIPFAILIGGSLLTLGYIGGTIAMMVALPAQAVSGPEGFMNGIRQLTAHLGLGWLVVPVALLVAVNAIGGSAANLSSTSRLPFVAGIDHFLPPLFSRIHHRYRTPWVAIAAYGAAGMVVALVGQLGTTVAGAYNVLVSMAVLVTFLPYIAIFLCMIRVQFHPDTAHTHPDIRRVPGGKPVALLLATIGSIAGLVTLVLSAIPAADEPNKPLALLKVIGGAVLVVAAGAAVFLFSRWKTRSLTFIPANLSSGRP